MEVRNMHKHAQTCTNMQRNAKKMQVYVRPEISMQEICKKYASTCRICNQVFSYVAYARIFIPHFADGG
jgi:hypothetical protein